MTLAALVLSLVLPASAAPARKTAPARTAAPACLPQKIAKKTVIEVPGGGRIRADIVDTPKEREKGLMCRTRLARDYGMLFVFPADMELAFWMKDTLVSLDMVWIGADKRVNAIHARMPKSTTRTPDSKVARAQARGQYVLELPAGAARRYGLKVGSPLKFDAAIPAE
ncbi:MAG: DUF192 domain-containing protein [Elusimicrobia bacterium]|nr:DUF192 domain-containing protein [Elusimicrobiota bacterium]